MNYQIERVYKIIKNPIKIVPALGSRYILKWMPDELYLKLYYRAMIGKRLNLEQPKTFNEKLQWLKLHDRNPQYTELVDKYEVRKYVESIIGKEYLIPLLGVWDNYDNVNYDILPDKFVLKCTHDSGGIVICKDKSNLDRNLVRNKLEKCLNHNFYWYFREWPYKNVKPQIIAEEYMVDESGTELKDYKFFCFDGEPKALFIATDRGVDTRFDFFDMDFNHLPLKNGHENANKALNKPQGFDEMKELAIKLSNGFPHVRVDFYNINGKVYFGELTFYHWSGLVPFEPEEWDNKFGGWIKLPQS